MMLQHDVLAVACFSLAHAGKVLRSLERDLFHSPMLNMVHGLRIFKFPHVGRVFRSLAGDLFNSPNAGRVFRSLDWEFLHSPMPDKRIYWYKLKIRDLGGRLYEGTGCKKIRKILKCGLLIFCGLEYFWKRQQNWKEARKCSKNQGHFENGHEFMRVICTGYS